MGRAQGRLERGGQLGGGPPPGSEREGWSITHCRQVDPDTLSQGHLRLSVLGVGGGKSTRKGLTSRRKSSAAPWSFRGCQQLRLCLRLVRALAWERTGQGQRGQFPYCFLEVTGSAGVTGKERRGRRTRKEPQEPHPLPDAYVGKNTMQKDLPAS